MSKLTWKNATAFLVGDPLWFQPRTSDIKAAEQAKLNKQMQDAANKYAAEQKKASEEAARTAALQSTTRQSQSTNAAGNTTTYIIIAVVVIALIGTFFLIKKLKK